MVKRNRMAHFGRVFSIVGLAGLLGVLLANLLFDMPRVWATAVPFAVFLVVGITLWAVYGRSGRPEAS